MPQDRSRASSRRAPRPMENSEVDGYLRVASLAIALYDFLWTLPAEWRLYRSQRSQCSLSQTCILFILNRYVSIAVLTVSNVGYFGSFSLETCRHYYLISPSFKALQAMVTQAILGLRTFTLSRRSKWVGWTMLLLYIFTTAIEWFVNIYLRQADTTPGLRDCISGNGAKKIAWIHYMVSIIYDGVALGISTSFLWKYSAASGFLYRLIRRMILEGLGYFIIITAINILNLAMYRGTEAIQSSAASLGYAVAWIMCQRILLNHDEAVQEHSSGRLSTGIISLETSGDVNRALRQQFESQKGATLPEFMLSARSETRSGDDTEMDVQVRVEQNVKFDYYSESELERAQRKSYRMPRVMPPPDTPSTGESSY